MGKIYSNTGEVRAWLGPAEDDSDLLLEHVEKYFQRARKSKVNENQKRDEVFLEELDEQFPRSALSALSQGLIGIVPGSNRRFYSPNR
jgi:hypothetical protein